MLGIHPNVQRHSMSTDVKYAIISEGKSSAPETAQPACPCLVKLSRVKVGLVFALLLLVIGGVYTYFSTAGQLVEAPTSGRTFTESSPAIEDADDEKIRYKHTKRRLPQCLVIGIRKAGTRALLTYLNLHPHIKTASEEIHFFDDEDNYKRGLEWYRKRMPYSFPEELTIEKTPAYFASKVVPDLVYHMNSSIRLLLVVRNPLDRMVSDYLQIIIKKQSKGYDTFPFEHMVLKRNGELDKSFPPLVRSVYYMYMENWLRKFPIEQFLIVDGDKLIQDPFQEMAAIEDFLGLERRIKKENFYFNESRGFFCIKNDTKEKCLAESKGRTHPDIDPAVVYKIKEFFRPYNKKFYDLVHKRFDWD